MGLFATLNPEQLGRVQRAKNAQAPFDIGACFDGAFKAMKADFWNIVLVNLAYFFLCIFLITIPPLSVGYSRFNEKVLAGQPAGVSDLFSGFEQFGSSWLMLLVMLPILVVAFLMCVLPGYYLAIAWMMCWSLLADRRGSFWECLEMSRQAVTAHWGWAFLLVFVSQLIAQLGLLACFIGVIATLPMQALMITAAYRRLFPEAAAGETVVQG